MHLETLANATPGESPALPDRQEIRDIMRFAKRHALLLGASPQDCGTHVEIPLPCMTPDGRLEHEYHAAESLEEAYLILGY